MLIRRGSTGGASGTNASVVADFISAHTVEGVQHALLRQVTSIAGGAGAALIGTDGAVVACHGLPAEQAEALARVAGPDAEGPATGREDRAVVAMRGGSVVLACLGGFVVAPMGGRMRRLGPSVRGRLGTIVELATLASDRA